ncbi:MMPL family transporter [Luteimonas granuli]|uniref:MMPL family transporter n=1 Tax=Luteimonas granuli TaxID=1176533 RepID=A0A518N4M0_9GAMM|nr:MMPL family transporter [Luteimonas granuli]QDW66858.1 MMPL family transporter [Luteimonas granuli]
MSPARRTALALLWLAALLAAGWAIGQRLELSGDLRRFMPEPRTPAQALLVDELGDGPGSRLLLLSLSGADPETLADQSRALAATLAGNPDFEFVANGADAGLEAVPESLRPYRYLLSPTLDHRRLDAEYLGEQFDERLQDLGSPMAALVEPLLPADPTLEMLTLAEAWQPKAAPRRLHGVWFDTAGEEALLLAQTRAAGFDPSAQQRAYDAVHAAFADVASDSGATLRMTGPGAFSVEIGGRTAREAQWIGTIDSIALILLLLVAYRSWRAPLLGVLPLATAGLAGLGAVALAFEAVHGITVAFGFTLIGVVQDYPIHFLSQQRAGISPRDNVRALWPALLTGVVATCIAYLTFLFSGVDGLRQLAVFTISALAAAALATRYGLPALVDPAPRDLAGSRVLQTLWGGIQRLPRPRWSLLLLAAACVTVLATARGPFWENDLSKLTPVPTEGMALDARLRQELGAPDVRYIVVMRGADADAALAATEVLHPRLDALVAEGALDGYDSAARYLPSAATQRARQRALPAPVELRAALDAALAGSPFRADAFEPFLADVERARTAEPLRPADLAGTPLAATVEGLLLQGDGAASAAGGSAVAESAANDGHTAAGTRGATALVSLSGLEDVDAVVRVAADAGGELLDMKAASESLVAEYRGRVLAALAVAALLLAATVWIALRSPGRVVRVLLPMALTTLVTLAVLRGLGVELNLFHLVALILAAGLGLDYALFFEHAGDRRDDQLRTLHAVLVCSLMTLLVFSLLALSSIPVLRAIGGTVAIGVLSNFVLALLVSRHDAGAGAAPDAVESAGGSS